MSSESSINFCQFIDNNIITEELAQKSSPIQDLFNGEDIPSLSKSSKETTKDYSMVNGDSNFVSSYDYQMESQEEEG